MTIKTRLSRLEARVEQLQTMLATPPEKVGPFHAIKQLVADRFRVNVMAMEGRVRLERIVWPRFVAMHLIYKFGNVSLTRVGQEFNRCPWAPRHAILAVESRMSIDPIFAGTVRELEAVAVKTMSKQNTK